MKRGCFYSFFMLIIFVGVLYYLYENYGDKFYQSISDRFTEVYEDEIRSQFENLSGEYADSLKLLLSDQLEKFKNQEIEMSVEKLDKLKSEYEKLKDDLIIDSLTFHKLKKMLKDEK